MKNKILALFLAGVTVMSCGVLTSASSVAAFSMDDVQIEDVSMESIELEPIEDLEDTDVPDIDPEDMEVQSLSESEDKNTVISGSTDKLDVDSLSNGISLDASSFGASDPGTAIKTAMSAYGISENSAMSDVFSATFDAMNMSSGLKLSDALTSLLGENPIDISFDVSDKFNSSDFDAGLLSMQYDAAMETLNADYENIDLSGKSTDCMTLFNSTYGDVAKNVKLEEYKIPKNFNVKSMLKSSKNAMTGAYKSATDSGGFKQVKQSISIGNIFAEAARGVPNNVSKTVGDIQSASGNMRIEAGNDYMQGRNLTNGIADRYMADMAQTVAENNLKVEAGRKAGANITEAAARRERAAIVKKKEAAKVGAHNYDLTTSQ